MAEGLIMGSGGGGGSSSDCTAKNTDVVSDKTYIGYDTQDDVGTGAIPAVNGGTKYATTSDQTLVAAKTFVKTDLIVKGLTASNLTKANVRSGKTISLSGGGTAISSVAGTFTDDATASASYVRKGKTTGYKGSVITGTMPEVGATTYYPGTSDKTIISAGTYLTGNQTIAGTAELKPENIVAGVTIFNVIGTFDAARFKTGTIKCSQRIGTKRLYKIGRIAYNSGTRTSTSYEDVAYVNINPGFKPRGWICWFYGEAWTDHPPTTVGAGCFYRLGDIGIGACTYSGSTSDVYQVFKGISGYEWNMTESSVWIPVISKNRSYSLAGDGIMGSYDTTCEYIIF